MSYRQTLKIVFVLFLGLALAALIASGVVWALGNFLWHLLYGMFRAVGAW